MLKLTYKIKNEYKKARIPKACFGHGDRISYVLDNNSIRLLNDTLPESRLKGCVFQGENTTINYFKDGTVNLMILYYSNSEETYKEKEIFVFNKKEIKSIKMEEIIQNEKRSRNRSK